MAKSLKLIQNNPKQEKQNALKKVWKWLNKPIELRLPCRYLTKQQKIDFLRAKLANIFGDYYLKTKTVDLFPTVRAELAVKEIIKKGLVDDYFNLFQLPNKIGLKNEGEF